MDEIVDFLRARAGDDSVEIDFDVAFSESETGARNRSLAHFMDAFGNLTHPVETVVGVYFRQCAIAMSCRSEEHTSELPSLMRTSYAVFCLKKKTTIRT